MRRLLALLPLLLVIAGAVNIGRAVLGPRVTRVARVQRRSALETVFATGYVEARARGSLRAPRVAEVEAIYKHEREPVKKGEPLLRLVDRTLDSRRQRARAELDFTTKALDAQSAFRAASLASIREAAVNAAHAKREHARRSALVGTVFQEREVEEWSSRAHALDEHHRALGQRLEHELLELESRRLKVIAELESITAAERDAVLVAPVDGVVLSMEPRVGETVSPTQEVAKVGDVRELIVEADVDEDDIGGVRIGHTAVLRLAGNDRSPLRGEIYEILPDATKRTKTFRVRLRIVGAQFTPDNPDTPLVGHVRASGLDVMSGMSVELGIIVKEEPDALTIPVAALTTRDTIFAVSSGNVLTERKVKTGIKNFELCQVLSGVSLADTVAVENIAHLKNGQAITPQLVEEAAK